MDSCFDLRLDPYLNSYVIGPTSCGKTFLCCQIVLNRQRLFKKKVDGVIYCYKHYQSCFDDLKAHYDEIQFTDSVEELKELVLVPHSHYLVLFDDHIVTSLHEGQRFITEWFLVSNHHHKCSTIFQSQVLFPKNLKCLALNSAHFVLFKSNNLSQIQHFLRQIEPNKWKSLLYMYNECVDNDDFGIFVLNLHPRIPKQLKFRSFLLPQTDGKVFVLK